MAKTAALNCEGKVLPLLIFEGTVFSGTGAGKRFIDLPWVRRQIEQKLGFTPYSGTLNIRLTEESKEKRKLLDPALGLRVEPEAGYFLGVLFKAVVDGVEAAVVVPVMPDYPSDILEVIAPLYLRGKLGVGDGAAVAVAVTV